MENQEIQNNLDKLTRSTENIVTKLEHLNECVIHLNTLIGDMTELKAIIIGRDGNNGLKSKVIRNEERLNYVTKIVYGAIGFMLSISLYVIVHWIHP